MSFKYNLKIKCSLFLLSLIVAGCAKKDGEAYPVCQKDETKAARGFSLSPFGFPLDFSKIYEFFSEASTFQNGAVMWNGNWRDSLAESGEIPAAAAAIESVKNYCFTPYAVFGWKSGTTLFLDHPDNATNNWTNINTRAAMKNMLVAYVTTYKPKFIFLGNETDFFYEAYQADYANWLTFYNDAYDAIRAASPSTLVGPVFNFEHIAGQGTLTGWTTAYWGALTDHDFTRVDVVGVTVYPFFEHANAADVPVDYLQPLIDRIAGKPIAITETGWPAESLGGFAPGWTMSEAEQVTYISRMSAFLSGHDVRILNWLNLNQMVDYCSSCDAWKIFGSVSLKDADGKARPARAAWKNLSL